MQSTTSRLAALVVVLLFALAPTQLLAQVTFPDFTSTAGLSLNGSAVQAGNVLRLTAAGSQHVSGTAWSTLQPVAGGFTSIFEFRITHSETTAADGFAFVVQNAGSSALGGSGGAIGYGAPDEGDIGTAIPNSLAIEFDTYLGNSWDPSTQHIAIQSCGISANTQKHPTCTLGINATLGVDLTDGAVHKVVIEYDGNVQRMRVFLDTFATPVLDANVNLGTLLSLGGGSSDSAFVGFTGSTGALTENNDILSWTFTPASATGAFQTSITQTLGGNGTNDFVFGSYDYKAKYSAAATNNEQVTVTAIPNSQTNFQPRLGTQFPGASCVVYDGTGGLCVLFRVQCAPSSLTDTVCDNLDYDVFDNFNSSQTINRPCLLKAPIGTTGQWQNIITSFTQTRFDPGTQGTSKGFSDFIVAQNCTDPPNINISSPANNAVYAINQPVTASYVCSPPSNGPNVTITSCQGSVLIPFDFNTSFPGTISVSVTATDSLGDTAFKSSTAQVGYGACLLYDPTKAHKSGSTAPLKFYLCDFNGADLSNPALVVHATSLVKTSNSSTPLVIDDAGNSNPDNDFRFDSTLGPSGGYIFNLKTTGLSKGTYNLGVTATGDPVIHILTFQIR